MSKPNPVANAASSSTVNKPPAPVKVAEGGLPAKIINLFQQAARIANPPPQGNKKIV